MYAAELRKPDSGSIESPVYESIYEPTPPPEDCPASDVAASLEVQSSTEFELSTVGLFAESTNEPQPAIQMLKQTCGTQKEPESSVVITKSGFKFNSLAAQWDQEVKPGAPEKQPKKVKKRSQSIPFLAPTSAKETASTAKIESAKAEAIKASLASSNIVAFETANAKHSTGGVKNTPTGNPSTAQKTDTGMRITRTGFEFKSVAALFNTAPTASKGSIKENPSYLAINVSRKRDSNVGPPSVRKKIEHLEKMDSRAARFQLETAKVESEDTKRVRRMARFGAIELEHDPEAKSGGEIMAKKRKAESKYDVELKKRPRNREKDTYIPNRRPQSSTYITDRRGHPKRRGENRNAHREYYDY